MQLQLLDFVEATQRFAAAAQASAGQALDFTLGSVLRAIAEANATVGLWVQWQIVRVRSMTRLATSTGSDVDSFVGDFGLTRLPGAAATGSLTFVRNAPAQPSLIVPGTLARTADGTAMMTVTANPVNALWNGTGYLLPIGFASATLPAICTVTGQIGNVGANSVTQLATAVPGIDTVTNAAPFAGGLDAESDAALTLRFQAFIASLSQATTLAILYAAGAVQQGLALQVVDGPAGSGIVTLYVDDGTGAPSPALLSQIAVAVELVRPAGVQVVYQGPRLIQVSISLVMTYPPGTSVTVAEGVISAAISAYVASLGMGASLSYAKVAQIALDAAPLGSDVASLLINAGTAAVQAGPGKRVHLASLAVA